MSESRIFDTNKTCIGQRINIQKNLPESEKTEHYPNLVCFLPQYLDHEITLRGLAQLSLECFSDLYSLIEDLLNLPPLSQEPELILFSDNSFSLSWWKDQVYRLKFNDIQEKENMLRMKKFRDAHKDYLEGGQQARQRIIDFIEKMKGLKKEGGQEIIQGSQENSSNEQDFKTRLINLSKEKEELKAKIDQLNQKLQEKQDVNMHNKKHQEEVEILKKKFEEQEKQNQELQQKVTSLGEENKKQQQKIKRFEYQLQNLKVLKNKNQETLDILKHQAQNLKQRVIESQDDLSFLLKGSKNDLQKEKDFIIYHNYEKSFKNSQIRLGKSLEKSYQISPWKSKEAQKRAFVKEQELLELEFEEAGGDEQKNAENALKFVQALKPLLKEKEEIVKLVRKGHRCSCDCRGQQSIEKQYQLVASCRIQLSHGCLSQHLCCLLSTLALTEDCGTWCPNQASEACRCFAIDGLRGDSFYWTPADFASLVKAIHRHEHIFEAFFK